MSATASCYECYSLLLQPLSATLARHSVRGFIGKQHVHLVRRVVRVRTADQLKGRADPDLQQVQQQMSEQDM